ncbi:MAG: ribonuclease P protein component [Acholeplasmatales bacterium]|nr:ribonuclease P protein component [Acholeplasmatales bacterium]
MKKQYRVKKNQEIELILKNKKYSSNQYFTLYKRTNPETSHFRYAISVGKKIGNAVLRNKIKRQVTAIIDNLNLNLDSNTDVFIIVRPKVLEIDFNTMKSQLEYLFNKQKLL